MFTKYFERGLSVIPIAKGRKNPAIEDWSRFCEHLPSEQEIEAWERLYDLDIVGIGLCLGKASGIIALDIDTDDPQVLSKCPVSPISKRGKKGETRFFRYSPDIQLVRRRDLGVEILTTGAQTVLPPSIHPETKESYRYLTPDTLLDYDLASLPALDLSFMSQLAPQPIPQGAPAIGRNNKLVAVITAMRARGETEDTIAREIIELDEREHTPPLLTDPTEQYAGMDVRLAALKLINSVTRSLLNRGLVEPEPQLKELDTSNLNKEPMWRKYPEPRGLMKLFAEYCQINSAGDQDALGLGGAIALMGAVTSNRFRTEVRGLQVWPCQFVVNLARSGFGKETPQRLIQDVLAGTGLVGAANYRSGTSIVMGLPEHQERLDLIDECSSILQAMTSKELYQKELVEVLSSLWSKSSGMFDGFTSAGSGERKGACWNPCVNILGSTTLAGFVGSVNRDMAAKGLMPRFLVFYQKEVGEYRGRSSRAGASSLMHELKQGIGRILAIQRPKHPEFTQKKSNLLDQPAQEGTRFLPHLVPFDDDAYEMWLNYEEKLFYERKQGEDSFDNAFKARFAEHIVKLALLDTLSQGHETISTDSVNWAKQVVETQWFNVKQIYEVTSGENFQETAALRVIRVIREQGGVVPRADLLKKCRWLKTRQLDEILNSSVEMGLLARHRGKQPDGGGKAPELYALVLRAEN